ncbi:MAG: hypothetical protein OWS74_04640 [Firmicutes bacterium]|nr:hypothetical protein [Bacillota bacterium]
MGFFDRIKQDLSGTGNAGGPGDMGSPRECSQCHQTQEYIGAHALRTGGLQRGWGVAADVVLGAGMDDLLNQATEKNVVVHVFVCPACGHLELVNDPRHGFRREG